MQEFNKVNLPSKEVESQIQESNFFNEFGIRYMQIVSSYLGP
jgi:hypothetical protein